MIVRIFNALFILYVKHQGTITGLVIISNSIEQVFFAKFLSQDVLNDKFISKATKNFTSGTFIFDNYNF
ncbi:hypothetical protein T10_8791 [Trichinella papuae]|uniref:Uncharacterized protein n=1 Tax=Trichinella papuae TaxID=268474 RepID=A0A0V1M4M3_9BILA|nr:hypothetical protein T10_8791 [Trichinella papuae]